MGHFAPRIQEKTALGYDEDEVTLAVEAGEHALQACGAGPAAIGALAVIAPRPLAVSTVAEALGIAAARAKAFTGTDSGAALNSCLDHVKAEDTRTLCIAVGVPDGPPSDPAEHGLGAGALAAVCGPKGLVREQVAHLTAETLGTDRGEEMVSEVLDRLAVKEAAHVFAPEAAPGSHRSLEKRFGKAVHGGLSWFTGDLGAASALASLAAAGSRFAATESVLLITRSSHSATAVHLTAEGPLPGAGEVLASMKSGRRYIPYDLHLRGRLLQSGAEPSQGAYVSPVAYLAELPARYRLVGEECRACGTLHFPPRETCSKCGSREFRERPLKRTGEVFTYTVIGRGAAPSEFAEQQAVWGEYATAVISLDDGPRLTAMLTDVDPKRVSVGMRVEMAFRRLYTQERLPRYGFKFRPE